MSSENRQFIIDDLPEEPTDLLRPTRVSHGVKGGIGAGLMTGGGVLFLDNTPKQPVVALVEKAVGAGLFIGGLVMESMAAGRTSEAIGTLREIYSKAKPVGKRGQ